MVLVLEHAVFDSRLTGGAVEDPRLPTHLGAVAVGREVGHRRVDHHGRETVGLQTLLAAPVACSQEAGEATGPLLVCSGLINPSNTKLPSGVKSAPTSVHRPACAY